MRKREILTILLSCFVILGMHAVLMFIFVKPIMLDIVSQEKAFKAAPIVLETPLGVPVEYQGHKIILREIKHEFLGGSFGGKYMNSLLLEIDGQNIVISPGTWLDKVPGDPSTRFAFYLPEKQKLILKDFSDDKSVLRWTNQEF